MALVQSEQLIRSLAQAIAETFSANQPCYKLSAALQRLVPNLAYRGYVYVSW